MGVAGSLAQTMSYTPVVVVYSALACAPCTCASKRGGRQHRGHAAPGAGGPTAQVWLHHLARTGAGIAAAGVVL